MFLRASARRIKLSSRVPRLRALRWAELLSALAPAIWASGAQSGLAGAGKLATQWSPGSRASSLAALPIHDRIGGGGVQVASHAPFCVHSPVPGRSNRHKPSLCPSRARRAEMGLMESRRRSLVHGPFAENVGKRGVLALPPPSRGSPRCPPTLGIPANPPPLADIDIGDGQQAALAACCLLGYPDALLDHPRMHVLCSIR